MTFLRQETLCCSPCSLGCRSAKPSLARAPRQHFLYTLPPVTVSLGIPSYLFIVSHPWWWGRILRRTKVLGSHWSGPPRCCFPSPSSGPLIKDLRLVKFSIFLLWDADEVQLHLCSNWHLAGPANLYVISLLSEWAYLRS